MSSGLVLALGLLCLVPACGAASLPVVLWHGMGDSCCLPFSMGAISKAITKENGAYVHSIRTAPAVWEDELSGFLGHVDTQVEDVCAKLKADPKLAGGFNAVGFSQGGQFLRAYVQRCNDPPVHNLITFGGQHMGVMDLPDCTSANASICHAMAAVLAEGAYAPIARGFSVQAQYFRSPLEYEKYLEHNTFLADINNERTTKNATYKKNLESLNTFLMIKWSGDTVVVPRESEHFGAYKTGSVSTIVPMEEQPIFQEDWIGLKALNSTGKLLFQTWPGEHMTISMDDFKAKIIDKFLM